MRVFMHIGESAFAQQMSKEWLHYTSMAVDNINDADVLWITPEKLDSLDNTDGKKVVLVIDTIDTANFNKEFQATFEARDKRVDWYHVPCGRTAQLVTQLTIKPIFVQPYWVNTRMWYTKQKVECREAYGLPQDKFLIGSFRANDDGPDVFCEIVSAFNASKKYDVHVLLSGEGQKGVIDKLKEAEIPHTHIGAPEFNVTNDLYNTLDLYVISARTSGGPREVYECAATLTQVISTPVGNATGILGPEDGGPFFRPDVYEKIVDLMKKVNINRNYDKVMEYFIPHGIGPFERLFGRIVK